MADPDDTIPPGSLVLVSMPGHALWGCVGELVSWPAADGARVQVLSDGPDVPATMLVPAAWVRRLSDVFDMIENPGWLSKREQDSELDNPPTSRQHAPDSGG